jgi:hypothetical protein
VTVYYTTLRGTLATGTLSEIFSHSLGIISSATAATVAQAVRDTWQTAWTAGASPLQTLFAPGVVYVEATAAQVLDPMVPDLGAAEHSQFSPSLPGTGLVGMLPSQNALAVSLTAGLRPNGTPFKGRFYLPPISSGAIVTDGLLNPSLQVSVADAMESWLNALSALQHYPAVWSRTVEDLVNPVSQVRVGNKLDTIRSRRNALPETYEVRAVIGPQ